MPRRTDPEAKILDAALVLIENKGYAGLTMTALARAAKLSLAALYRHVPSKHRLISLLMARIDLAMLAREHAFGGDDRLRDRLFDVLMDRFEVMAPYRAALLVIDRDLRRMPGDALAAAPALLRAMRWSLEAAGLQTTGLKGAARERVLAAIFVGVQGIWLGDDDPGLAKTMATLDRRLRRAEELWRGVWGEEPEAIDAPAPADEATLH